MNEQILKKTTATIEVSASSEKYVNAVSQLFTEMREQVYKNLDGKPLINLKAEEVYFDSIDVEREQSISCLSFGHAKDVITP